MEDDVRHLLFDPLAAHALVLAHRPPAASAVDAVVSDAVWTDVVRLLRWAAADPHGVPARETGSWWRLAAGCAELLRRLPGLGDEVGEAFFSPDPVDDAAELGPVERIAHAAEQLAALLQTPDSVPLIVLAPRVGALGAAAVSALAWREFQQLP